MFIAICKHQDIQFLNGASEKIHKYHAVEGFNVSFQYNCYGTGVHNWWAVDGSPISCHNPPYPYDCKTEISSADCINTLTLILYNVRLNYTNNFTTYPSKSIVFNYTRIRATAHLSKCRLRIYYMHM